MSLLMFLGGHKSLSYSLTFIFSLFGVILPTEPCSYRPILSLLVWLTVILMAPFSSHRYAVLSYLVLFIIWALDFSRLSLPPRWCLSWLWYAYGLSGVQPLLCTYWHIPRHLLPLPLPFIFIAGSLRFSLCKGSQASSVKYHDVIPSKIYWRSEPSAFSS